VRILTFHRATQPGWAIAAASRPRFLSISRSRGADPGSSAKHTRKVHPSNGIIDAYLESGFDEVFDGPMEAGTEEDLRIRVKSDKNVTEDTRVIQFF
jgi:hypothetical protein